MYTDAVRAKRFELVDDDGNVRAEFGMKGNGAVRLNLYDQGDTAGRRHDVAIGVDETGAHVELNVGRAAVGLVSTREEGGTWGIAVTDLERSTRFVVRQGSDGVFDVEVPDGQEGPYFRFETGSREDPS